MIIDELVTLLNFKVDKKALAEYKSRMKEISSLTRKLGQTTRYVLSDMTRGIKNNSEAQRQLTNRIKQSQTRIRLLEADSQHAGASRRSDNNKLIKQERLKIALAEKLHARLRRTAESHAAYARKQDRATDKNKLKQDQYNNKLLRTKILVRGIGNEMLLTARKTARGLNRSASVLIRFRNLMGVTIAGALGLRAVGSIIETGSTFEKNRAMLRRFAIDPASPEATAPGNEKIREEIANKEEKFIDDLAIKTPLNIREVTDAFVDMKQRGMEPMNGMLKALIDTNAAYGGGAEELRLELIQIGQAWGKNKLQGQDARILMEKRLPLMKAMVQVTGKSIEEIYKEIEAGKVNREVLQETILLMGDWSKEAAAMAALRFDGLVNKLGEFRTLFERDVGDAGFFGGVKAVLAEIVTKLTEMRASGEMKEIAEKLSATLGSALNSVWEWLQKTIDKFIAGEHWLQKLSKAFGGFGNVLKTIGLLFFTSAIAPLAHFLVVIIPALHVLTKGFSSLIAVVFVATKVFGYLVDHWDWIKAHGGSIAVTVTAIAGAVLLLSGNLRKMLATRGIWAAMNKGTTKGKAGILGMINPTYLLGAAIFSLATNWDAVTTAMERTRQKLRESTLGGAVDKALDFVVGGMGRQIAKRTEKRDLISANEANFTPAEKVMHSMDMLSLEKLREIDARGGIQLTPPTRHLRATNTRTTNTTSSTSNNSTTINVNSNKADAGAVAKDIINLVPHNIARPSPRQI